MSNLHLVTGYAGQAHVTAADDGSFNRAIFGGGQYVLDLGSKLAASVVSNNKITIADGDLLMQGRHIRLNEGTTVDLTINNGAQGKLRNDLIVARYTKDSVSGVEEVNLVVIQGTAVDSDPVDPEYTSGDIINDHALLNDMPLYRVPLNGLTLGTPVALFSLASVHIADGSITGDKLSNTVNALSLGGAVVDLLWENASPTSKFTAQTIELDLNNYDYIMVPALYSTSYQTEEQTTLIRAGHSGYINFFGNLVYAQAIAFAQRYITINADGAVFASGYSKSANATNLPSANDSYCIPLKIYGIKGVM